ncbi:MAG: GNAT family N-acetyltransferase [Armatimonadetes bacterium]|jgi:GNAT superfamily N-acetyltransferase|nr:GNAT family N-acetyltransferase [Armatimonadota bacterium]HOC30619.1 GNAT family N-acetyltransferase [Armatimonadota bacterium]
MSESEKTYSVWPWSGASPFSSFVMAVKNTLPAEDLDGRVLADKILWDANWEPDGMFVLREHGDADHKSSGGGVRGFCVAIHRKVPLENTPMDSDRGYITLFGVDPRVQRRGYGNMLFDHAEAYLRVEGARKVLISPYAPNYFWPGIDIERYEPALRFLLARGYREVNRPLAMEADLRQLKWPEWARQKVADLKKGPDSVEIRTYSQDLVPFIHDFMFAEFPGDWQRWVREAALDIHAGVSKPDRLLFAWDNATHSIVGFCHWNGERFGPFGTSESVRGRGIGAWLMFDCLERMRSAGKPRAYFLWTDDRTAKLYAEAGFREWRRFAIMAKDL